MVIDLDEQPGPHCVCRNEAEHVHCPRVLRYERPEWFEDGGEFDPAG
jgi:hypothetical protein